MPELAARKKREALAPLAKIFRGARAKAVQAPEEDAEEEETPAEIPDGAKPGPMAIEFKSKVTPPAPNEAPAHTITTWGPRATGHAITRAWRGSRRDPRR